MILAINEIIEDIVIGAEATFLGEIAGGEDDAHHSEGGLDGGHAPCVAIYEGYIGGGGVGIGESAACGGFEIGISGTDFFSHFVHLLHEFGEVIIGGVEG